MQNENVRNVISCKIQGGYFLCVTACLCLAYGAAAFESGTFAFYPFRDSDAGISAVGVSTITNLIDDTVCPAGATTASGGGSVLFCDDAPGRYIFEDVSSKTPTPVYTDPKSIWITGNGTGYTVGGYITFKGLCGRLCKSIAENGTGTMEFFWRIPDGEYRRTWCKSAVLYGDFTVSGRQYSQLFFAFPLADSGGSRQQVRFCHGYPNGWDGITSSPPDYPRDKWMHVALVYSGGNFALYADYIVTGATTMACTVANPEDVEALAFMFGCGTSGSISGNNGFRGRLSCLRVTSSALTPDRFLRASDSPCYYDYPDKVDMGADTLAFYPFKEGDAGSVATPSTLLYNVADPSNNLGKVTYVNRDALIKFDDDAPGPYVFTNFAYGATAVYTNPCSVSFEEISNLQYTANIDFSNITTMLSERGEGTVEFFWKLCETNAEPSWKSTMSWNVKPQGCVGNLVLMVPLIQSQQGDNRGKVWLLDVGKADAATRRCIYTYQNADGTNHDIVDSLWHHLAVTYSNGVFKLYCDYSATISTSSMPFPSLLESVPFSVGCQRYRGKISCLRVSGKALSTDEMLHVSTLPTCLPESILWYRFENAESGANITSVSNSACTWKSVNGGSYWGGKTESGTGSKPTNGQYPVASQAVWRKYMRDSVDGSNTVNQMCSYFESLDSSNVNGSFASGPGISAPVWQTYLGSITAEIVAKLDYDVFKRHIIDVGDTKARAHLIDHYGAGRNTGAWKLYLNGLASSPYIQLDASLADGALLTKTYSKASIKTDWHHYAVVYDKENLKLMLYLDHVKVIDAALTMPLLEVQSSSDRYRIASGGNNNPFSGWIDEVRITRGVLTPEEFLYMGLRRGSSLTFR